MIWHSGISSRDPLDRLQGPQAELAVVLVAGADREGQRVEQQVRRRQAVLVAGEIDRAAAPPAILCSTSLAMPVSSIVSAMTAVPKRRASFSRLSAASSPSSKLIELMIGLPP